MTSPLVRAWLSQRLPDWADHAYACWRGFRAAFGGPEWDPCQIEARYLQVVPAPAGGVVAAGTQPGTAPARSVASTTAAPSPAFHTLMICEVPFCRAGVNQKCVTRFGNVTGPHRARRDAAARQTAS